MVMLHDDWHSGCRQVPKTLLVIVSDDFRPTHWAGVLVVQPLADAVLTEDVLAVQSDGVVIVFEANGARGRSSLLYFVVSGKCAKFLHTSHTLVL